MLIIKQLLVYAKDFFQARERKSVAKLCDSSLTALKIEWSVKCSYMQSLFHGVAFNSDNIGM